MKDKAPRNKGSALAVKSQEEGSKETKGTKGSKNLPNVAVCAHQRTISWKDALNSRRSPCLTVRSL